MLDAIFRPRTSTIFFQSKDVYLLRITHKGEKLFVVYDSLGNKLGIMEGEYEPWAGSHLLGIFPFEVDGVDFQVMKSSDRYTPPNRR